LDASKAVALPYVENTLEFAFVGVTFINEKFISYRYRLHGYDDEWISLMNNHYPQARYANLDAGDYWFEVQVRRGEGKWGASLSTNVITVRQAFVNTPLFFFLMLILVSLASLGIGVFLKSKMNERRLVKKVQEKTKQYQSSEAKVKSQNQELINLNEELDRFTYSVSHDLKSPLNSINGLVEVIRLSDTAEEQEKFLDLIKASSVKLKAYIDDLHQYSRNKTKVTDITEVNLMETLNAIIDTQRYVAKGFRFDTKIEGSNLFQTDKYQFGMILTNLISNAVKYRSPYGEPYAEIQLLHHEKGLTIKVEDNGIGIEPARLSKIFDIYAKGGQKAKDSSGLGLFIVKNAVDKLGGDITVRSAVNKGTEFTINLPRLKA
jgi:signal transduction histidine kinase